MNQQEDLKAFNEIFSYKEGQKLSQEETIIKVARMDAWNEALKYERAKPDPKNTKILTIRENLIKYRTALNTTHHKITEDIEQMYRLTVDEL